MKVNMNVVKHVVVAGLIMFVFGGTMLAVYERSYYLGSLDGYAAGWKSALNSREPSDELEMVCARLWVGEQYKIYERRQRGEKH